MTILNLNLNSVTLEILNLNLNPVIQEKDKEIPQPLRVPEIVYSQEPPSPCDSVVVHRCSLVYL